MRQSGSIAKWVTLGLFVLPEMSACAGEGAASQPAGRIAYQPGREVAKLLDARVAESSGVACSRIRAETFWTHNDSGDGAVLYAFDRNGKMLGAFTLFGCGALDWEDICSFRRAGKSYLLVGDVGDNLSARPECQLYLIEEPNLDAVGRAGGKFLKVLQTIRFTYEDGPRNCESLAVDPTDGSIYLASKTAAGQCNVYRLPCPIGKPSNDLVAKPIAALKVGMTTAMDISPDGLRAVVLTYADAYEYVRGPNESWAVGFGRPPRRLPMPRRRQGEAICYGLDGRTLWLTSEGRPMPLFEVPATGPTSQPSR